MTMTNRTFASITSLLLIAATGCASNLEDERIDGAEDLGQIQAASVSDQAPSGQKELNRGLRGQETTAKAAGLNGNTLGSNLGNGSISGKAAAAAGHGVRVEAEEPGPSEPGPSQPTFKSFEEVTDRQLNALANEIVFSSPIFFNTLPSVDEVTDVDLGGAVTPLSQIKDCVTIVRGDNAFSIHVQCADDAGITTDALAGDYHCSVEIPDEVQLRIRCSVGLTERQESKEGSVNLDLDLQGKRNVATRFIDHNGYVTNGSHSFRRVGSCSLQSGRISNSADNGELRMSYDEVLRCNDSCLPNEGTFRISMMHADPALGNVPEVVTLASDEGVWSVSTSRGTFPAQDLCR